MSKRIALKIDGVVLLDKPVGITSQTAVTVVKRSFNAQKAGHTGTLDPLATGLLPVCLGEATKYSQDLLNADKTYIATILFGAKTDSGDAEGKIISRGQVSFNADDSAMTEAALGAILPQFSGEILQVPPMHSALKRDGKPLYEYARAGEVFELEPRRVTIHSLRWISIAWPLATLEVSCSKGTYIRSLANDMGDVLGCGAHLTALRRTRVGHLDLANACTIEAVRESKVTLLPVDALVQTLPSFVLDEDLSNRLALGQRIPVNLPEGGEQCLRIYRTSVSSENFMGTVDLKEGVLHPRRLISQNQSLHLAESEPAPTSPLMNTLASTTSSINLI